MEKSIIIFTYKNKILLFSYNESAISVSNTWDFVKGGYVKKTQVLKTILTEVGSKNTPKAISDLEKIDTNNDSISIFNFRLSDSSVNNLIRNEGWRMEFYRLEELQKIDLNTFSKFIYDNYKPLIKGLLENYGDPK